MHEHLRREKGLLFPGIPVQLKSGEIHHYLGMIRRVVYDTAAFDRSEHDVAGEVVERLHDVYGCELDPDT